MENKFPPRPLFVLRAALLLGLLAVQPARAAADFGSWHALSLRVYDDNRWTLSGLGQLRFRDDSSQLFATVLSAQTVFKAHRYLRLGLNYTSQPAKPAGGAQFLDQKRWEFEVNPRWPVSDRLTLELRNRYEIRRLEGRPGTNERTRHRPQISYRLPPGGSVEAVFANHETFYDLHSHRRTENRLVPFGLDFRLSDRTGFRAYYLIRSVRGPAAWTHSHILGTQISLSL